MSRFTNTLARVRVAAPCEAEWDEMRGDERVRFCHRCSLNVYNLSAMTRREAERLVTRTEGRLCVRFYRRKDGTMMTQSCPVGLRALKRRASRVASAAFATLVGFVGGVGVVTTENLYQIDRTAQDVVVAPPMPDPPPLPEEFYLASGMMARDSLRPTAFLPAGVIATGVFIVGYPLMRLRARREAKRRKELRIWGDS